jgi:hypothetical protein
MRVRSEARFSVSARMARHYHIWLLRAIRFMAQAPSVSLQVSTMPSSGDDFPCFFSGGFECITDLDFWGRPAVFE